jgi:hypothetical protein
MRNATGYFLPLVVPRLDHVAVHGLVVPADEVELLVFAEATSGSISPALGVIARRGALPSALVV